MTYMLQNRNLQVALMKSKKEIQSLIRNGIMLINDDGELTIYSTNKISSINK